MRNVLKFKPTNQSSAYYASNKLFVASLAVDGNMDPYFWSLSCFHCGVEPSMDNWMQVDMLIPYKIDYVVLWSRDVGGKFHEKLMSLIYHFVQLIVHNSIYL